MRALIQRVSQAEVIVDHRVTASINQGLLVFLGVEEADDEEDMHWLVRKISRMRIFSDNEGKMNLSVQDVGGRILVVSQFTLHASTKKGNRPSFVQSAPPEFAKKMYKECLREFEKEMGDPIESGVFGAHMDVKLVNDGPVTIFMDSKNKE